MNLQNMDESENQVVARLLVRPALDLLEKVPKSIPFIVM